MSGLNETAPLHSTWHRRLTRYSQHRLRLLRLHLFGTKNSRRRCSLYLSCDNTHLVIDTPPDFREQVLTYGVPRIDALFITHAHADHIMGFDDVRRFSHHHTNGLPVYSHPETLLQMRTKFDYVLQSSYAPNAVPNIQFIPQEAPIQIGPLTITPLARTPRHHCHVWLSH